MGLFTFYGIPRSYLNQKKSPIPLPLSKNKKDYANIREPKNQGCQSNLAEDSPQHRPIILRWLGLRASTSDRRIPGPPNTVPSPFDWRPVPFSVHSEQIRVFSFNQTNALACVEVHERSTAKTRVFERVLQGGDRWLMWRGPVRQIDLAVGFRCAIFLLLFWGKQKK